MVAPPTPADEAARLDVLRCYRILDTPPEREFDDLARLAAHVAGMPIALVTLVDEKRQWFKARVGLVARETPRDVSFCAHAILRPQEPLVVEEPLTDERFADNPDVTGGLRIRYYAGVPLVSNEGQAVGTLCVVDQAPNRLAPHQLELLRGLARQAVALLELRKAARELDDARQRFAAQEKALALHELVMGVAHEVNNPLAFMRVSAQLAGAELRALEAGELDAGRRKRVERASHHHVRVSEGIERLARVSAVLQRVTRTEHGTARVDAPLSGLVARALPASAPPGVHVRVEPGGDARVRVAEEEVVDAIAALVQNAIESVQGKGGRVVVRASTAQGEAHVDVEDDGVGIAEADRPRVFTPFFTTKAGGMGCSLAIARRVIHDHGGRIAFSSPTGGGCAFRVTLPLAHDESARESAA